MNDNTKDDFYYKSELCIFWKEGKCWNVRCTYAHGPDDLRRAGCDLCNKSFNSVEQKRQHMESFKHRAKQAKLEGKPTAASPAPSSAQKNGATQANLPKKEDAVSSNTSQKSPDFSYWSHVPLPVWSDEVLDLFEETRSQVRVREKPEDEVTRLGLYRLYHNKVPRHIFCYGVREMQKGLNNETIQRYWYEQEELRASFKTRFKQRWGEYQDWCKANNDWKVFSSSSLHPHSAETSATSILEKLFKEAEYMTMSTTGLGQLIAGTTMMKHEFEAANSAEEESWSQRAEEFMSERVQELMGRESDLGEEEAKEEVIWRKHVAMAVVRLAPDDHIDGTLFRGSIGRKKTDKAGKLGETELEKQLKKAGISEDKYKTEKEQQKELEEKKEKVKKQEEEEKKEQAKADILLSEPIEIKTEEEKEEKKGKKEKKKIDEPICTPDILFHEPIKINGRTVKWLDSKKCLLLPGVSSKQEVDKGIRQMAKYTDQFGPGAILWLKSGFCQSIVDKMGQNVAHFTISKVPIELPAKPDSLQMPVNDQSASDNPPVPSPFPPPPLTRTYVPRVRKPLVIMSKDGNSLDSSLLSSFSSHGAFVLNGLPGPPIPMIQQQQEAAVKAKTGPTKQQLAADAAEKRMRD